MESCTLRQQLESSSFDVDLYLELYKNLKKYLW